MGLFPKDRNLAEPPDKVELEVRASDFRLPAADVEVRLDAFLQRHLTWRSRSSIQALIRDGYVFVATPAPERPDESEEPAVERRTSRKLRHGARVVVVIPEELRIPPGTDDGADLVVLYEDEEVVAIDKPPFLPVHPSGRHLADTLIQRVHRRYRGGNDDLRLPIRLCHRLDRETSGVVLIAKGDTVHRDLMRQFERRRVQKEYLAIVRGEPAEDGGVIDLPLGPARQSSVHLKIAAIADGQPSRTEWRVVERRAGHALVACNPVTGRQHQVRVHLDAIGHPLVGDKLYGVDEGYFLKAAKDDLTAADLAVLGMPRHALHNHRLVFTSPSSGERREVTSPLAGDMRSFLGGLEG